MTAPVLRSDSNVSVKQQPDGEDQSKAVVSAANVRVVGRIRPLAKYEIENGSTPCVLKVPTIPGHTGPETLQINPKNKSETQKWFELDAVLDESCSQKEVYEKSGAHQAISEDIFQGFNCTILAYGQTGAGKTFTMGTALGAQEDDDEEYTIQESDGVIPRACHDLFQNIRDKCDGNAQVECSYMEVYNEEIRDLLSPNSTDSSQLRIRETLDGEVYVRGLESRLVTTPLDVGKLMEEANGRRVVASTKMNATSSRSHAICVLKIKGVLEDATKFEAKLTLVDLAGSEKMKKTGASGARAAEGISINKGLFVLGQVVSALAEQRPKFKRKPPFRDSKLTRLLQDSLGGNSRTIMVACCSPADFNMEETINTLRYATQARNIKNSATANVVQTISQEEAMKLKRENALLKSQVEELQETIKRLTQDVTEEELERSVSMIHHEQSLRSLNVTGLSAAMTGHETPEGSPSSVYQAYSPPSRHTLPPTPELEHPDPYEEDANKSSTQKKGGGLSLDAHFSKSSNTLHKAIENLHRGDEDISLQVDDVFDTHSYMTSPNRRRGGRRDSASVASAGTTRTYQELEEENVELEARLRLAERDIRATVHDTAIEMPALKMRVQQLEDTLNESMMIEDEANQLRQELAEAKADKESAQRAAQQLAEFMEQQKKEFGFRGDELEKKRMQYFRQHLDEKWVQFVVTILSSFKEQMRLLGDYFDMVVRVVDSPEILSMLGPSNSRKKNGGWWRGKPNEDDVQKEKELRNRLLQEHIKFFNARLVEVEDEINGRSENVDAIYEGLSREREEMELELDETEFVKDLFSKKGEHLLIHLTKLMTGPLFSVSMSPQEMHHSSMRNLSVI
ncbi:kinesin motor domain containing protein [Nitzschia inconspicua]|uniref:Kinesin-like protein n=1 Tax=Nitzschia inconspicua TaxID=303405 RepID=A0A9K3LGQ4_9STRA|nr:kinesin motor domain containing protein [Nitzschia inconspicua]